MTAVAGQRAGRPQTTAEGMMTTRACAALIALVLLALVLLAGCSRLAQPAGPVPVDQVGIELDVSIEPTASPPGGDEATVQDLPTAATPAPADPGGWRAVAPPPIPLRTDPAVAWTGEELVVVGGQADVACTPGDPCVDTIDHALVDGAAYDPADDRWRRIADLPEPLLDPLAIGTTGSVVVGRPDDALWRYDAASDTWEQLRSTRDGLDAFAVDADRLVAYASTREVLGPPDQVLDPDGRWRSLPPDPLGLTRDRRMVWVGDGLVLLGVSIDPQVHPPVVRAAWLADPLEEDPDWQLVSDSATQPGAEWLLTRLGLVGVGGPPGGVLQLDPPGWWDLPPLPEGLDTSTPVRVPAAAGGRTVVSGAHALDLATGTWTAIPDDPALPSVGRITAWAGDRVLTWGGPSSRALVWLPPWAGQPVPEDASPQLRRQRPLPTPVAPRPPGPQGRPDGRIDCPDEARTRLTDLLAGEQPGRDTAEEALRHHLGPQAEHDDGHVVTIGDIHASIVVGYRETLSATALRQSDGRWVVGLLTACGDVDLIIR